MTAIEDIIDAGLPDLQKSNRDGFRAKFPKEFVLTESDVVAMARYIRDLPLKLREDIRSEVFEADLARINYTQERAARYTELDSWYAKGAQ